MESINETHPLKRSVFLGAVALPAVPGVCSVLAFGRIIPCDREVLSMNSDRRARTRYPISLPLQFVSKRTGLAGGGQTIDLSSSGTLIVSSELPPLGSILEVSIAWPFLLDSEIPLQLVARARVARHVSNGFAVEFSQHQFKTAKKRKAA